MSSAKRSFPHFNLVAQWFGVRHVQYLLLIFLIIVGFGMRVSFNVSIIAMISDEKSDNYPTYPEMADKKQILLSGFFCGYICFQVVAGQLAKKFGTKYPLLCAITLTSLITICIPVFAAHFGHIGVLVCRVLQGLTQGFIFPSIHTVLSAWAPLSERTKYGSIVFAGGAVGNIVGMPVAGALAASSVGWPASFYVYGASGLCWCVAWLIFGASGPASSKWISEKEKTLILSETGGEECREKIPTPWKAIFTSTAFYALLITHCGQNWTFWILLTEIPSYLSSILKFDIASNSLLSTLPYLVLFIVNIIMSQVADMLIVKKILSLEVCRKLFNSIGLFSPCLALLILCIVGSTSRNLVIFLLVVGVSLNAGTNCGLMLNHIDLSPVHSGTLMGITNSAATIFSILAPLAVGILEKVTGYEEQDEELWNIVFYVTAGILLCVANVFIFGASTEVQPWNSPATKTETLNMANGKELEPQKKISTIF